MVQNRLLVEVESGSLTRVRDEVEGVRIVDRVKETQLAITTSLLAKTTYVNRYQVWQER